MTLDELQTMALELEAIQAEITADKKALKKKTDREMELRKAVANAAWELNGGLNEGTNNLEMPNDRNLKINYAIDRKIEVGEIENARRAYDEANNKPAVTFDDILKVTYALDTKAFRKVEAMGLNSAAYKAVSRMVVAKPKAPTVEVD